MEDPNKTLPPDPLLPMKQLIENLKPPTNQKNLKDKGNLQGYQNQKDTPEIIPTQYHSPPIGQPTEETKNTSPKKTHKDQTNAQVNQSQMEIPKKNLLQTNTLYPLKALTPLSSLNKTNTHFSQSYLIPPTILR